jgi:hypothetical protein
MVIQQLRHKPNPTPTSTTGIRSSCRVEWGRFVCGSLGTGQASRWLGDMALVMASTRAKLASLKSENSHSFHEQMSRRRKDTQ